MKSIVLNGVSVRTGGGLTYLKNLCVYLPKVTKHMYYIIIPYDFDETELLDSNSNSRLNFIRAPKCTNQVLIRLIWEQFILPIFLKLKINPACTIGLANIGLRMFNSRQILVIQSIAPYTSEGMAGKGLIQKLRYWLLRFLTKLSLKKTFRIVALSDYTKQLLHSIKFPLEKIVSIPLGVPEFFYSQCNRLTQKKPEESYYLCVSSLSRHKNFDVVIKAIGHFKKKGINLHLKIAGSIVDKKYHKELVDLAKSYEIKENVHFLGNIDYSALPSLYYNAKAFILPSMVENFPHTLVEAMSSGSVVISSETIPTIEICDDAALTFNPHAFKSLAKVIESVEKDPTYAKNLRLKSVEQSKKYSWENVAKIYATEIDKVIECEFC